MEVEDEQPAAKRIKTFPSVEINVSCNYAPTESQHFEHHQLELQLPLRQHSVPNVISGSVHTPKTTTPLLHKSKFTQTSQSSTSVTTNLNNLALSEPQLPPKTNIFFNEKSIDNKIGNYSPSTIIPKAVENYNSKIYRELYDNLKEIKPNQINETVFKNITRFITLLNHDFETLAKEKLQRERDLANTPTEKMDVTVPNCLSTASNIPGVAPSISVSSTSIVTKPSTNPRWIVAQNLCQNLFESSNKDIKTFLIPFISQLYGISELLSSDKNQDKKDESEAVVSYFWNGESKQDITTMIENQCSSQRRNIAEKLYSALNNCKGVIMSKDKEIFECRKTKEDQFVPKTGKTIEYGKFEWKIPEKLRNESYVIAAAKNSTGRPIVYKIEYLGSKEPKITELARKRMKKKK